MEIICCEHLSVPVLMSCRGSKWKFPLEKKLFQKVADICLKAGFSEFSRKIYSLNFSMRLTSFSFFS